MEHLCSSFNKSWTMRSPISNRLRSGLLEFLYGLSSLFIEFGQKHQDITTFWDTCQIIGHLPKRQKGLSSSPFLVPFSQIICNILSLIVDSKEQQQRQHYQHQQWEGWTSQLNGHRPCLCTTSFHVSYTFFPFDLICVFHIAKRKGGCILGAR